MYFLSPYKALQGIRRHPWWTLAMAGFFAGPAALAGPHLWAEYHFQAGVRALGQREFQQARGHFAYALRIWPANGRTHFLMARASRRAGLFEQALDHLRLSQRAHWDESSLLLERTLLRAQRGDLAVEEYLRARLEQADADVLEIFEALVQLCVDSYRLSAALHYLELYLERKPDDVAALLGRAWIWEQRLAFADAVLDYRRAAQLRPNDDQVRLRLAQALLVAGPAAEAVEHFENLHRRQPDSPVILLGLARGLRQLARQDEARLILDRLLTEYPQHADAILERGLLALDQGQAARAEIWLRRAAARAPADRSAIYNLCQCLQQQNKQDEAAPWRARLERLDADMQRINQLMRLVLENPHDPALRCEAGIIFLRNGDESKGVRWLEMALREDPKHAPAHQALADYFRRSGHPERAELHRRLAVPAQRAPGEVHRYPEPTQLQTRAAG